VVPLGVQPRECHDPITPNDMHSSLTCGFSGALLMFGGWAGVFWGMFNRLSCHTHTHVSLTKASLVFLRALSLHLQICWQLNTGKSFFYGALVAGWGIPAVTGTVALCLTGVSFRFGNTCHINHNKALQDFWGPLLGVAAATVVIQFAT
jgi:hypothetical protein